MQANYDNKSKLNSSISNGMIMTITTTMTITMTNDNCNDDEKTTRKICQLLQIYCCWEGIKMWWRQQRILRRCICYFVPHCRFACVDTQSNIQTTIIYMRSGGYYLPLPHYQMVSSAILPRVLRFYIARWSFLCRVMSVESSYTLDNWGPWVTI